MCHKSKISLSLTFLFLNFWQKKNKLAQQQEKKKKIMRRVKNGVWGEQKVKFVFYWFFVSWCKFADENIFLKVNQPCSKKKSGPCHYGVQIHETREKKMGNGTKNRGKTSGFSFSLWFPRCPFFQRPLIWDDSFFENESGTWGKNFGVTFILNHSKEILQKNHETKFDEPLISQNTWCS